MPFLFFLNAFTEEQRDGIGAQEMVLPKPKMYRKITQIFDEKYLKKLIKNFKKRIDKTK